MIKGIFKLNGVIFLLSAVLIFIPQLVSAIGIEVAVGMWNQDPDGDFAFKGTSLSVENELKYNDETRFMGRIKLDLPSLIPNFYLMASSMKFKEPGNKDITFQFGDIVFNGNFPFNSDLRLDHYDAAFYYGLPFLKKATNNTFNVDLGLNVKIIDLEASITQGANSESKSFTVPVPMVYLGAQWKLWKPLSLEGELRAITYSSNHYYDWIGRVTYTVLGPAFIGAGYRYENIKIDVKDVRANLRFSGLFAEVGVKF